MTVVAEKTRPAQVLAGKRAERVVMRNGSDANRTRRKKESSGDISGMEGPNSSSSENNLTLMEARAAAQRRQALIGANLIRMERAATKRRLERGELDWDTFLDETPEACLKVQIGTALQWLPYVGPDRASRLLNGVPEVDLTTLVRDLSAKAKYALSRQVTVFYRRNSSRKPRST